jgi:hypothetical protein
MKYNLYVRGKLVAWDISSLAVETLLMSSYRLIPTSDIVVSER